MVVIAILSIAIVGCRLLSSGLGVAEDRGAAQVLQTALASAQLRQQWQASAVRVELEPPEVALVSDSGQREVYATPRTRSLGANVAAWREAPNRIVLTITGPLSSPDSGGTVSLGDGYGVVIRPESGFARRIP
jgi:hypothetical protein